MIFKQFKSEGLAHYSYLIGSGNECAIIDPRRDVEEYLSFAHEHGLRIKYVFETHRNEDYLIGSREVSKRTKARILHGKGFKYGRRVKEGDEFKLSDLTLRVIDTPGHSMDSISITADNVLVFTGDALFAGDVGRTDLIGKPRKAALMLYNSLQKLLELGDGVIVCPGHGSGSVCGASISDKGLTTIGYERVNNELLKMDKESFIEYKVSEEHHFPKYFKMMEKWNNQGPPLLKDYQVKPLTASELDKSIKKSQVIDIRNPEAFSGAHVPGTLNIWVDGLPLFAGYFLNYKQPIIMVCDDEAQVLKAVTYLQRLGYDKVSGFLLFKQWFVSGKPLARVRVWSVKELMNQLGNQDLFILDVRAGQSGGKVPGSRHVYVGDLDKHLKSLPRDKEIIIYCDSGFKTSVAASILQANGFKATNVLGGFKAWQQIK